MLLIVSLLLVLATVAWFVLGVGAAAGLPFGYEQLIHQRIPWLVLATLGLGCGLGIGSLVRRRSWYAWGVVGVELVLSGLLGFYLLQASFLPQHTLALAVGDPFPAYALQDHTGALRSAGVGEPREPALYIFYRGDW